MSSHARNCERSAFSGKSAALSTCRRLRAVVADDTPDMLDCISAIFETEGGPEVVATASNGTGAIRDTKVLLVSADDDHELGLCALDCGADGFIWKGAQWLSSAGNRSS